MAQGTYEGIRLRAQGSSEVININKYEVRKVLLPELAWVRWRKGARVISWFATGSRPSPG